MDFFNGLQRAYGQFDKKYTKGMLPGGAALDAEFGGKVLAAQEAVPAILRGAVGAGDTTKTSVHPRVQSGLLEAYQTAKSRGAETLKYEDYNSNNAGGYGARHIFGDISMSNIKVNDKGEMVGLKPHAYDTNKTVKELTDEIDNGILQEDGTRTTAPMYKRAERELARHQDGGIVHHDLTFDTPKPAAATRKAGEADISVEATAPPDPQMSYAVRAGDTLSAIARSKGTTVDALAKLNNISNVDQIGIGQQIRY
tara:strand:+ start:409 stop:1170 length:762 start_codon:yes stop_codon:yes gene_type:complete